jgi:hypothetical protein
VVKEFNFGRKGALCNFYIYGILNNNTSFAVSVSKHSAPFLFPISKATLTRAPCSASQRSA